MEIAVCDDDALFLKNTICMYLKFSLAQLSVQANISIFTDGKKLLESVENRDLYDIVILDVEMPSINGKELAGRLRMLDASFRLIFVTAHKIEVYNTLQYHVNAFIPKDSSPDRFIDEFKRVISEFQQDRPKYELFEVMDSKRGKYSIKLVINDIFYICCVSKSTYLHTYNNEYELIGENFQFWLNKYTQQGFVEICRGYLVNLAHIEMINEIDLVLDNGECLPVSRRRKKMLLDSLSRMISQEVYL